MVHVGNRKELTGMTKLSKLLMLVLLLCSVNFMKAQTTLNVAADEHLYRDGMDCIVKQQYTAARNLFERYIGLHKNDLLTAESHYRKAYCALQLQNADAEELYQYFIDTYPEHIYTNQAYLDLGGYYFNKKQYEKTIEYLSQLDISTLSGEQKADASFQLGYSYFTKKDFENALPHFNTVKNVNKH